MVFDLLSDIEIRNTIFARGLPVVCYIAQTSVLWASFLSNTALLYISGETIIEYAPTRQWSAAEGHWPNEIFNEDYYIIVEEKVNSVAPLEEQAVYCFFARNESTPCFSRKEIYVDPALRSESPYESVWPSAEQILWSETHLPDKS